MSGSRLYGMVLVYGMADSCLYNKHNNTWTLGDMEFIFSCSHSISHSFAALTRSISMWTLEDTFHISARPCIILYVNFTDMNYVVLLEYCSWNWLTSWCSVFKKINPFCMLYVRELSIHVHCKWLANSVNKCVPRMTVSEIVIYSVCQGNLIFSVREKSWNFRNLWLWQP